MRPVDAVVVGAGAAGGIVAKELATAGLSIVLLERGKWLTFADCPRDDLRNQRNSQLGCGFGPEDEGNPRVWVDAAGAAHTVRPSDGAYSNNASCVGGGTVSWGAQAWRFMPQDFKMRSIYGAPEGSSLEDWPITYGDLEPFYEKAEYEIGVSGDYAGTVLDRFRKRPLPMPPLPANREFEILAPAAKRLGLHPMNIPMARNSVPYHGRAACVRCRWCVGFACEVDAKNGSQNTVIPVALNTGNCELRTGAQAKEILTDDRGRARGVSYFDEHGQLQQQPAGLVVVSACAVESARLLLNSKSRFFPAGLGNRHDMVGRNLQGHHYSGAIGYFEHETYDGLGPGASVAVVDYNHGSAELRGGGMLANEFIRLPIQMVDRLPEGAPKWGAGHKQAMRRWFKRNIGIMGPTQQIPSADARVTLDPAVRDRFGIPVARISGNVHPETFEIGAVQAARAEAWLKEAGAVATQRTGGVPSVVSAGQHQAGTCRMGDDPRTSVVDRNCRVHDMANVFVIDASVHVTNGGFNPALTVMAIAYYASNALVKGWKGGGYRG